MATVTAPRASRRAGRRAPDRVARGSRALARGGRRRRSGRAADRRNRSADAVRVHRHRPRPQRRRRRAATATSSWSFADDPGWSPKLVLRMTCAVANRYLHGRESLAIAIARRRGPPARPTRASRCSTCRRRGCSRTRTAGWSRPTSRRSRPRPSRARAPSRAIGLTIASGRRSVDSHQDGNRPEVGRAARAPRRLGRERRGLRGATGAAGRRGGPPSPHGDGADSTPSPSSPGHT